MIEPIDWCAYFQGCEERPTEIQPKLTVGQWLKGKDHIQNCDVCFNRMERTVAKAPKKTPMDYIGEN